MINQNIPLIELAMHKRLSLLWNSVEEITTVLIPLLWNTSMAFQASFRFLIVISVSSLEFLYYD